MRGGPARIGSLLKLRRGTASPRTPKPWQVKRGWRIKSGHPAAINQQKRHLPLRQLFPRVPNRLVRLQPCWMMCPLAVSTYLESPEFPFDVALFD